MNIYIFTNPVEDYLADSILIGILRTPGINVHQYPVKEIVYKSTMGKQKIRGNGFTLYHVLADSLPEAVDPESLCRSNDYDLIIFSSIQRQFGYFLQYLPFLKNKKVWILDGEDTPGLYGFHGYYWRNREFWGLPKAHNRFLYFKREWTPETIRLLYYKLVPPFMISWMPVPSKLRPISFSIPAEKIVTSIPVKTKLFPRHIVDEEIARHIPDSESEAFFSTEEEYYQDLQSSKFGITTKRSGWDCLRHYEIAANGAVICFRSLDKKAKTCAPHGLIPDHNCISYRSFMDLNDQIKIITAEDYQRLQENSLAWIRSVTCESMIMDLLSKYADNN